MSPDTTLTAGVLSRLDLLTAKLGVASHAIWALWLATWWRPLMSVGVLASIAAVLGLTCVGLVRLGRRFEEQHEGGLAGACFTGAVAIGAITTGVLIALIIALPDAISYAINHQLYALDQLKALVGR